MKIKPIKIKTPKGVRLIGPGQPVFIIAEMSGNHNQNIKKAYEIIDAAINAGADAVKMQTYTADTITIDCDNKYFQVKVNEAWKGQTLYSLYKKAYTPWEWQAKLKKYGESKGILVFSTPFDTTAVDFLEKLNVVIYKVASFEVVDIPLLERIGRTKKPVVISRGMSTLEELKLAVKTLKENGAPQVAVFHCVSAYPADPARMNLKLIPEIIKKLRVPAGLSDHSLSNDPAIAAVVLGASLIEKHLILKRTDDSFDANFSIEPPEFKRLVKSIRSIEASLGKPEFKAGEQEKENLIFRKSLFVVRDIKKGEKFTPANIRSIRPGHGLEPKYYNKILGKTAKVDIEKGTPLDWNLVNFKIKNN